MSELDSGQSAPNPINQDKNKQTSKRNLKIYLGIALAAILVALSFIWLICATRRHDIPADKAVAISIFINSTSLLFFPLFKLLFPETKRFYLSFVLAFSIIVVVWCVYMGVRVINLTLLSVVKLICLPIVTLIIALFAECRQQLLDKKSSTTTNTIAKLLRWCLIALYIIEIVLTCWVTYLTF